MNDDTIHVAEINPTTGIPNEVASVGAGGQPTQIEIAQVTGHIYILSSEGAGGLQVYEYTPPASLQHIATLAGTVKEVEVRGPQPFPALFLYRDGSGGNSYVDIYDTKWLGGSGTPLLAKELQHYGSGISFKGLGFEAEVVQSGAVLTAYVHRKLNPPPPGLPGAQSPIRTDKIDISCIAADPTAPPVALATMINLSAQARSAPENTKNYFGDKWELLDSSVTYQPLTNVQWDIDTGASGPFAADPQWSGNPAQNPELEDINPAYWPCNPSGGGNLALGTACFGSVGGPVGGGTFYLGLKTTNQNGASAAYFSPGVQVLAPTASLGGLVGVVAPVLAGNPNNGDASASTGNTAEATFSWTFTPSGNASGTVVTIPPSATGFSLLATYKDGFSVTKTGSIQQVDLVPNFSLTPTTVLKGGTMTSKNLMQKAAAATLNSVDYAFTPSGGSGTLVTCPGGFCNVNGTAPVTAPDTIGNYTLTLTYKYT